MKDKTPIYMFAIVLIVAIVGFFLMMSLETQNSDNSLITGNVVTEQTTSQNFDFTIIGKIFFVLMLGFMAVYLYKSK